MSDNTHGDMDALMDDHLLCSQCLNQDNDRICGQCQHLCYLKLPKMKEGDNDISNSSYIQK